MGMTIRHVVLVSGVIAAGAFIYVVGFSPMDESGYGVRVRSGGAGADSSQSGQTSSRRGMIASIRRALIAGQMDTADRIAGDLILLSPDDPSASFYRAMVDMELGKNEKQAKSWAWLDRLMDDPGRWTNQYSVAQAAYYRGWSKHGIREFEESRQIFNWIADKLEADSLGPDGRVTNPGVQYNLACYRAMGHNHESAIEHWEQANLNGYADDGWWRVDPDLESLHRDPRFWAIGEDEVEAQDDSEG